MELMKFGSISSCRCQVRLSTPEINVNIGIDVEVREKSMQMDQDVVIGWLGGHPISIHPKTRLNPSRVNLAILFCVLDTVVRTYLKELIK